MLPRVPLPLRWTDTSTSALATAAACTLYVHSLTLSTMLPWYATLGSEGDDGVEFKRPCPRDNQPRRHYHGCPTYLVFLVPLAAMSCCSRALTHLLMRECLREEVLQDCLHWTQPALDLELLRVQIQVLQILQALPSQYQHLLQPI